MYRLRMESCLLLGAALLAGCSDRNTPTAPSGDAVPLSPAGFIGDRPYTWTAKCSGDFASQASWSWTSGGGVITRTGTAVGRDSGVFRNGPPARAVHGVYAY